MTTAVVWHRADLRVPDNPAVAAAGTDATPLFVVDPSFYAGGLACDARAADARERFSRLADRAREALEDPAVRHRASLSRRHETVDDDPDSTGQASLTDF